MRRLKTRNLTLPRPPVPTCGPALGRLGQRHESATPPERKRRALRQVKACTVQFIRGKKTITAHVGNLTLGGLFIQTTDFLPLGETFVATLALPDGPLFARARVVHLLPKAQARVLGRRAGMGVELLGLLGADQSEDPSQRERLACFLDLSTAQAEPETNAQSARRVLVVDPSARLLDRLATALGDAGFFVETAFNGAEAYAACLGQLPHAVLACAEMPVMDGWRLASMLASRPEVASVPVLLMSSDSCELTRLRAYRMGIKDFVQRPFTDEEICIRLHRVCQSRGTTGAGTSAGEVAQAAAALRGRLAEIGVGTLLSLLEFERKSGILQVSRAGMTVRLFVASGQVIKLDPGAADVPPRRRLLQVLDWRDGEFEFTACTVTGSDEIGLPTSHLLLEHACLTDEAAKASPRTATIES